MWDLPASMSGYPNPWSLDPCPEMPEPKGEEGQANICLAGAVQWTSGLKLGIG